MATMVNIGEGGMICNLLASLTSVPTSSAAVSGTDKWNEYDIIVFNMSYKYSSDVERKQEFFCQKATEKNLEYSVSGGGTTNWFALWIFFKDSGIYVSHTHSNSGGIKTLQIYGIKL